MRYRRAWIAGGSFFFTVVTAERRPLLASVEAVNVLRLAFRAVRARYPFEVDAMVALPDHLHCIWSLPADDADFATRWRLIKTWFTKHYDPALRTASNHAQSAKREQPKQLLWQHRYWEHALRDEVDSDRHTDYIHFNPVKHGLVTSVKEWPYSSFHRYVASGRYPPDWGHSVVEPDGVGHE
ncbi:MAG: transposase [Nitrosospira sp.]